MSDREKIITHLDDMRLFADTRVHQIVSPENWEIYSDLCDFIDLIKEEVLVLLKEQEPIEPVDDGHGSLICGNQGYECGCVGAYNSRTKVVDKFCNYCPECGRKVKWG